MKAVRIVVSYGFAAFVMGLGIGCPSVRILRSICQRPGWVDVRRRAIEPLEGKDAVIMAISNSSPARSCLWAAHLLARCGDVATRFDDPLSAVVMRIELGAECFKHVQEWGRIFL